jgi:hypothetical protein
MDINNVASMVTIIASIVTVAAVLFGAWRYIDTKRAEEQNERFEQFRMVTSWLTGTTEMGQRLTQVHQAIAVSQLREFPEYAFISLPIIEYFIEASQLGTFGAPLEPYMLKALAGAREHLEKMDMRRRR